MVAKNLKLIFKYIKLNLQKEYQYKTSFFTKIIMMILNNAFFILQWIIIFGVTESIGGYGFKEVMLLWALSAMGYGIAHALFSGAFNIANLIYEGRLDVFLTQPKNVLVNLICSETSVSALGDIAYSFIALALAGASWWWYLAIIPIGIVGALIYVGITICFQTLSFYVKRGSAIADTIGSAMLMFSNYPPVIFNTIAKILLFTIIPCGFMIFLPAESIFLGFSIWGIVAMLGFALLMVILAFILFKKGLKKYNSGSLMGGRL
jgi:ABC-2 type transport system permease protein